MHICSAHYANTPMQYAAIFTAVKKYNFNLKIFDIFLIFAQNIQLLKAYRIKFQKFAAHAHKDALVFAAHAHKDALVNETFIPT